MLYIQVMMLATFVIVFSCSTYLNRENTANQVAQLISTFIINEQHRDVTNSLSAMTKGNFSAVRFIDENNKSIISFPPLHSDNHPRNKGTINSWFLTDIVVDVMTKGGTAQRKGQLVFTFHIFDTIYVSLIAWGLFTLILIPLIRRYKRLLDIEFEKSAFNRERIAISQVIREVWHDIGQPLQILRSVQESSMTMSENEKEKILSSCEDIVQIVEQLKGVEDATIDYQLLPLIKSIIETEKVKYHSKNIAFNFIYDKNAISLFSKLQKSSLKRIIGNLVNNSVKAMDMSKEDKSIIINLSSSKNDDNNNEFIVLTIEDNGIGIKEDDLRYVGMKGRSFRTGGNGIGISSAIAKIEEWKGELSINSKESIGTKVTIKLNKSLVPEWAILEIPYAKFDNIVVLDDRINIFKLIESKLIKSGIKEERIKFFQNISSLNQWLTESNISKKDTFFICDYDLGPKSPTGISFIKLLDIAKNSVLLSNHFEDSGIQSECLDSNIKMAPKVLISEIFSA